MLLLFEPARVVSTCDSLRAVQPSRGADWFQVSVRRRVLLRASLLRQTRVLVRLQVGGSRGDCQGESDS